MGRPTRDHRIAGAALRCRGPSVTVTRRAEAAQHSLAHVAANDEDLPELILTYSPHFLLSLPDDGFLLFLCESVHPAVRSAGEVERLFALYNARLAADGWEVFPDVVVDRERPLFSARPLDPTALTAPPGFPMPAEELLAGIVELLKLRGGVGALSIVMAAKARIEEWEQDNWNGGTTVWRLNLELHVRCYVKLSPSDRESAIDDIEAAGKELFRRGNRERLVVEISPRFHQPEGWRSAANRHLVEAHYSNQFEGSPPAPLRHDGLVFRSQEHILLYKALLAHNVSCAVLPAFVHGRLALERHAPDLVVVRDGAIVVIHLIGETLALPPAASLLAATLQMGATVVRINVRECATLELAERCATRIVLSMGASQHGRR